MDESEEELGGRFALRAGGDLFGAGFGFPLPLGLPRGRFTGTSCASGSDLCSLFGGSTVGAGVDGTRANSAGSGGSSAPDCASSAPVFSGRAVSTGSRLTSIYLFFFILSSWLGGEQQFKRKV